MKNKDMKLLNKIKHIFDKKTYEFQIYVNEKETILIHGLKKKQIKNKITYQFIENKILIYSRFHSYGSLLSGFHKPFSNLAFQIFFLRSKENVLSNMKHMSCIGCYFLYIVRNHNDRNFIFLI